MTKRMTQDLNKLALDVANGNPFCAEHTDRTFLQEGPGTPAENELKSLLACEECRLRCHLALAGIGTNGYDKHKRADIMVTNHEIAGRIADFLGLTAPITDGSFISRFKK